jgi:hypothetical protein
VKHIWQSPKQHAPGSFNVAKDRTLFRSPTQNGAISILPGLKKEEKLIPVRSSMDMSHFKKYIPELSGVGGLGISAAPRKSLALDMNKTSLYQSLRPELIDNLDNSGIAIDCETKRRKTHSLKGLKKIKHLGPGAFRDAVPTSYDSMACPIHKGNKAFRAAEKSSVQNSMAALPQARDGLWWLTIQIVINHTVEFCRTISTLRGELTDRISLRNPASEPFFLPGLFGPAILPTEGMMAVAAKPPLFPITIMPIPLKNS